MQTRKKSVSLAALGIAIPGTNNSRASNRSAPPSSSSTSTPNQSSNASPDNPPTKRLKRSHTLSSAAPLNSSPTSPPRPRHASSTDRRPPQNNTPPPSPGRQHPTKIDTQGINDDIVVAVLRQLESTGNRPHLIKELAAVLGNSVRVVQSSSNPLAIISSRLTNYLRRPWTALAPCPLAKEQTNIHPRRVYFYLTTCPRQPIPEYAGSPATGLRIISPSVSSGPDEESFPLDEEPVQEDTLSDSLELEFASSDMNFDQISSLSPLNFSDSNAQPQPSFHPEIDNARAISPPLEHDEREFTHTASVMQARKQSELHSEQVTQQRQQSHLEEPSMSTADSSYVAYMSPAEEPFPAITPGALTGSVSDSVDAETPSGIYSELDDGMPESEETAVLRNHEAAAALFGQQHNHLSSVGPATVGSSPMLKPATGKDYLVASGFDGSTRKGFSTETVEELGWGELTSPEHVALSELDDLLGGY